MRQGYFSLCRTIKKHPRPSEDKRIVLHSFSQLMGKESAKPGFHLKNYAVSAEKFKKNPPESNQEEGVL